MADEIINGLIRRQVEAAVAAERERCREKVGAERDRWTKRLLVERAAERERCIQIVRAHASRWPLVVEDVVAAIRKGE